MPYDNCYLDNSQNLLHTLVRIRQGLTQEDLEFRFDVDQSYVSRILNQWIPLLDFQLRGLIKWPSSTIGPVESPFYSEAQQSKHTEISQIFCVY